MSSRKPMTTHEHSRALSSSRYALLWFAAGVVLAIAMGLVTGKLILIPGIIVMWAVVVGGQKLIYGAAAKRQAPE